MKSIVMDMRFVFLAILLAMFTQTLTSGLPLWQMGDSFIAMSLVVFASPGDQALSALLPAGLCLCHHHRHSHLPAGDPVRGLFIDAVAKISFLLLRAAPGLRGPLGGRSAGGAQEDVVERRSSSSRIVSTCCFFGASLVAQLGFSIQGII
jgi:hypothetical protein